MTMPVTIDATDLAELIYTATALVGPSTSEVARAIGYPNKTTHRALEDLAAHDVVTRQPGPRNADTWTLSKWAQARWPTQPEKSGASHQDLLFHSPNQEEDFSVPLNTEDAA